MMQMKRVPSHISESGELWTSEVAGLFDMSACQTNSPRMVDHYCPFRIRSHQWKVVTVSCPFPDSSVILLHNERTCRLRHCEHSIYSTAPHRSSARVLVPGSHAWIPKACGVAQRQLPFPKLTCISIRGQNHKSQLSHQERNSLGNP